jgi:hypothetical protein
MSLSPSGSQELLLLSVAAAVVMAEVVLLGPLDVEVVMMWLLLTCLA